MSPANLIPPAIHPAMLAFLAGLFTAVTGPAPAQGIVVPLDGQWLVDEGIAPDAIPASFTHQVPVPGLTNQAQPAFPGVDHYETHEFVWTMKRYDVLPATASCEGLGQTRQKRNFFWYERTFRAPARREHATLVVKKAQFGTAIWLNGKKIGEHAGCFTAGRFDVTGAMDWTGENRLVIRIGAHPGAMPDWAFWGSDGEKGPWTPGIYDGVELRLADNPVIEDVQVAPRIGSSEIVVQTRLKNHGAARTVELTQNVSEWKSQRPTGQPVRQQIEFAAGEEKTITQTVPVPDAVFWSPENPFLYTLETGTGGDTRGTRFGMREFRFDPATRLPMLNGKVCYLRGASITLHRFFGDPQCGGLPWNEAWVRKLLVDIPRRMNWNAFRICIGPAPQQWLDIADEAGLLLQYEFPIWSDREATPDKQMRHTLWREDDILEQMREFVRDNWNHPSVAIWDASNETRWDFLRDKLVPAVRGLDLSGRPWDNGYLQPHAPGDPYETHPYKFINHVFGKQPPFFQMTDLEQPQKPPTGWQAQHAAIINEYDWLWLHRDGTPTHLTRKVYENLLGPDSTPAQRFALNAYLLGGLTEYWRAQRNHAGVLYLAYLDGDLPHVFTCDNFRDVAALELEPNFETCLREAFKPVGVYLDFWQPTLPAGSKRTYRVTLVNDTHEPLQGQLTLAWLREKGGVVGARAGRAVEIAAAGRTSCEIALATPAGEGNYLLAAEASFEKQPWSPTVSRRKVTVKPSVAAVAPAGAAGGTAPPTVYWASDPVRPGEAVLVTGNGLTADCAVELFRLADGPACQPQAVQWPETFLRPQVLQPRGQSLKFVLPADLAPGVVAFRVRNGVAVSATRLLNLPDPWWCQGDAGTAATPGGTLRLFGKNLLRPPASATGPAATVALSGPHNATLAARGDGYNLTVDLPRDLPAGEYPLRVHSGSGGPQAWSRPLTIKVIAPPAWPSLTLNVTDFGADGRGLADDTTAIAEALTQLKKAGGGVLHFPRGRYLVSKSLTIPERTVLRGEKRELSAIAWPDAKEPLADLLVGTHSFAIEDLSFYCANYGNFLTVDLKSPQAGNVRLHRLRVVANRYRGHMYDDAEEMSRRFTRFGVHGGKLLALGGENVEVSDCDLLSSGCALYLTRARGARIANNVFRMGRFGWFWLSGSDGVVFENNECLGQDLSTWGGGINCLDGSTVSQHVYFARNTCSHWFGGDNELTTDGSGGAYYGKLATAEGTRLTTAEDPKWGQRDWRGAAVLVIGGRGTGQCRRVVRAEGRQIEIDRAWDVVPDASSQLTVTMYQGDYLLVNNRFSDVGVIQFYGMSLNHICAGNTSSRTAGFFNMGMNYHHIQPSWYVQWLDNVIEEGNGYDSAHRRMPREAQLGLLGLAPSPDFPHALNLASIARGNRLLSNAGISVGRDEQVPSVQDAIVERCSVQDNDWGISVAPGAAGVLLRENQFERVAEPVRDLARIREQLETARQRFAGQHAPLAAWDFADLQGTRLPDRSGNGLHARVCGTLDKVQEKPIGSAGRFGGETCLQLGFTRSPGYPYAQSAGLGPRHMQHEAFNQRAVTIGVWIKPEAVDRRQGLVGKRFNETSAPFVLSIHEGRIVFEAAEASGKWVYNVRSPVVLKPGQWQHVAAVIEEDQGVRLYLDGKEVLRSPASGKLAVNGEPLVIGREAWAAAPPDAPRGPAFYRGLMGSIKIWARALPAEEIAAESATGNQKP